MKRSGSARVIDARSVTYVPAPWRDCSTPIVPSERIASRSVGRETESRRQRSRSGGRREPATNEPSVIRALIFSAASVAAERRGKLLSGAGVYSHVESLHRED